MGDEYKGFSIAIGEARSVGEWWSVTFTLQEDRLGHQFVWRGRDLSCPRTPFILNGYFSTKDAAQQKALEEARQEIGELLMIRRMAQADKKANASPIIGV